MMEEPNENLWGRPLSPSESIRLSLDLEKAPTEGEKMEVLAEMAFGFGKGPGPNAPSEISEIVRMKRNP